MSENEGMIEGWAIVDQLGHVTLAGHVRTVMLGTHALLRLDTPGIDEEPGYTCFLGLGSLYRLTLVTEEIARAALRQIRPPAVTVYIPRQLPPGQEEDADMRAYVRHEEDERAEEGFDF